MSMPTPKPCAHQNFAGAINVDRNPGGDFTASITIRCSQCRTLFRFIGAPTGSGEVTGPVASPLGDELQIPIEPITRVKGSVQ